MAKAELQPSSLRQLPGSGQCPAPRQLLLLPPTTCGFATPLSLLGGSRSTRCVPLTNERPCLSRLCRQARDRSATPNNWLLAGDFSLYKAATRKASHEASRMTDFGVRQTCMNLAELLSEKRDEIPVRWTLATWSTWCWRTLASRSKPSAWRSRLCCPMEGQSCGAISVDCRRRRGCSRLASHRRRVL